MNFEYTSHWDKDESIFQNAENMTALKRRSKKTSLLKVGKAKLNRKKKMKRRLGKEKKRLGD